VALIRPKLNETPDSAIISRAQLAANAYFSIGADGMGITVPSAVLAAGASVQSSNQLDIRGFRNFTIAGNALTNALDITFVVDGGGGAFFGSVTVGTLVAGAGVITTLRLQNFVWDLVNLQIKNNSAGNATLQLLSPLFCSA
jgi:hypothetical protein